MCIMILISTFGRLNVPMRYVIDEKPSKGNNILISIVSKHLNYRDEVEKYSASFLVLNLPVVIMRITYR